jgi:hypothetical protein
LGLFQKDPLLYLSARIENPLTAFDVTRRLGVRKSIKHNDKLRLPLKNGRRGDWVGRLIFFTGRASYSTLHSLFVLLTRCEPIDQLPYFELVIIR